MYLDKFYNEEYKHSTSRLTLKSIRKPIEKGLFLDRDGVLIEDVHHIDSPDKVSVCKNVIPFLQDARKKDFEIVIITNQSSVSRSIISYKEYKKITERFLSYLSIDLYPDMILSSFHLPNNKNNLEDFDWRKPGTGMINYALEKRKYNKSKSFIVGDKLTDLITGYKSGISNLIYIESSLHKKESKAIKDWSRINNIFYKRLKELNSNVLL